jgi:hypothetical protein
VNSEAHGGKFNDGPARKPKLYQRGRKYQAFSFLGRERCTPLTGVGPLRGFASTAQKAALSGSHPKAPGSAGG